MEKLLFAIYYATTKHSTQKRKDGYTPYISHPLAVAIILAKVTDDIDIVIAGMLHDVIEECGVTKEELINVFGTKVANLVEECTERDKSLSWEVRKAEVLNHVKNMSSEAAIIKMADTLHNTYDMVRKLSEEGSKFFKVFNTDSVSKVGYERKLLEELKKWFPEEPLLKGIETCVSSLELYIKKLDTSEC